MRPKPFPVGADQESVWDYPRPPALEKTPKHLRIVHSGKVIATTNRGYRVLETSHPPNYYFTPSDVEFEHLLPAQRTTHCEWKGEGKYYHLKVGGQLIEFAAWYYDHAKPRFRAIQNYLAFYPALVDSCTVDDELVVPQPGNFYGGWITKDIVGPFKGVEGSWGW